MKLLKMTKLFAKDEDGAVTVWQPDLSKTGGLTEALHIARLAADCGCRIHPHTSLTALNMAASLHFLTAIPNGGYFEADLSAWNPFRDVFGARSIASDVAGHYRAPAAPGLGIDFDVALLADFAAIPGAGYV